MMALALRGIFIAVGASALNRFSWLLYLFGALLIYTAARLVLSKPAPLPARRRGTDCCYGWPGGWYPCPSRPTARA